MINIDNKEHLNKIYNEDYMEGFSKICSKSIDLILCDLPYGTTQNKWDSIIPLNNYIEIIVKNKTVKMNKAEFKIFCFENKKTIDYFNDYWLKNERLGLWSHYKRIIKDNCPIVLFGAQPFTTELIKSNIDDFKYDWIWSKTKGTGHLNAKKQCKYNPQFGKGEPYFGAKRSGSKQQTSSYGKHREINDGKKYPRQILKFDIVGRGSMHPTQKPVDLLEYLIKTYTEEGDTVIDNCMGVGSTAIACIKTNRKFIGFEMNEEYYVKAIERIKNEEYLLKK